MLGPDQQGEQKEPAPIIYVRISSLSYLVLGRWTGDFEISYFLHLLELNHELTQYYNINTTRNNIWYVQQYKKKEMLVEITEIYIYIIRSIII